ncbi:hypothetical protein [Thermococcus sp.]
MLVKATKYKNDRNMEIEYLSNFFTTSEKTAKMWKQLLEYVHPEEEKALDKYSESEKNMGLEQDRTLELLL